MYNHMVGRTASVISTFYFLLPARDSLRSELSRSRGTLDTTGESHSCMPSPLAPDPIRVQSCV